MKQIRIILFFILASPSFSQYSPSTEWLRIETEHFNLIYDSKLNTDVLRVANELENYYLSICGDLNSKIDKYTIVFPSGLTDVNAYVSGINNKSVFYSMPPTSPFAGSVEWYKLLVLHETRHMAQYTYLRDSLLQRVLEFLFGSYGILGVTFIPSYMYEGDAVLTETLLSESGRGRTPDFERELRTQLLSDKSYSFSKILLSSGRDSTPNQYVLGYYLMTYLKKEYGADILSEIMNAAANNPLPLNFSSATLFATGKTIPSIYNDVKIDLYNRWSEQDKNIEPTLTTVVPVPKGKIFTDHSFPIVSNNNEILYIEEVYNNNAQLVQVVNNKKIIHKSVSSDFSLNKNRVIYSVESVDHRWDYTGFSDLYIYDLENKKSKKITKNRRYFIPEYSTNGEMIATLEYSLDRTPSLIILDSNSFEIIQSIPFKKGEMINSISWDSADENIILTRMTSSGSSVGLFNIKDSIYEDLTESDNNLKFNAVDYNNYILFVSTYSGIENIHAVNKGTKEEFQVLSSRFGANYPNVKDNKLYFSQYTVKGYQLEFIDLDMSKWIPISEVSQTHVDYFEPLLETVKQPKNDYIEYSPKKYNPNMHLIDIHSWLYNPIFPSEQNSDVVDLERDGFFDIQEVILFSSDHLEKMESVFYSHYNLVEESFDFGSYGSYNSIFPKVYWDFNMFSENFGSEIDTIDASLTFEVPLTFLNNNKSHQYSLGLTPDFSGDYRDDGSILFSLSYYIAYYLDINNLEFDTVFQFAHGVNLDVGSIYSLDLSLEVPGFFRNQEFNISNDSIVTYSDDFTYNSTLMADYTIPFLYPDLSILNWVYIYSFDLDLFSETVFESDVDITEEVGVSLSVSYYLFRMPIEFYSKYELSYDFNNSKFDPYFTPISFNIEL